MAKKKSPKPEIDDIPGKFWAEWFDAYERADSEKMEKLLSKTLLGRTLSGHELPGMVGIANSFVIDLTDYLTTRPEWKGK